MSNSQERLSEEEVEFILGLVEYDLEEGHQISWGHAHTMFHEIKRLQAVEAERDRYKSIVDRINRQISWGDPYQHAAKIEKWIKQFHEGAEPNDNH